KACFLEL
ncbi:hypothetical protein ABKN59_011536, partial [Abortiporus biennis]